jgi:hypothetical protein
MDTLGKAGNEIIVLIVKRVELVEIFQDFFQLCVHIYNVEPAEVIVLIYNEFKSKSNSVIR